MLDKVVILGYSKEDNCLYFNRGIRYFKLSENRIIYHTDGRIAVGEFTYADFSQLAKYYVQLKDLDINGVKDEGKSELGNSSEAEDKKELSK